MYVENITVHTNRRNRGSLLPMDKRLHLTLWSKSLSQQES